ncbi:ATP-dependent DNA ligase [Brachybacterium nesterenkovii]|uniref:ATP-dependent DNA ligase n=1 Tax=Brachybacterium nesterenkovii TaxID=47847 RepID=UPI003219F996
MARKDETQVEVDGHRITLSHLDKVLYPSTGTTKADVIDYYRRAAAVMVPQAARRPATRKRWVDGVGTAEHPGKVFFRKDLEPSAPSWVPRADIVHREGTSTYPLVDEPAVLVWLAQLAALEIHTPQWRFADAGPGSRTVSEPRRPDRLVLDLDPGDGVGLADCAEVARWCREILDGMGMDSVPVTSGSKGIHLYAALDGSSTADEVSQVAHRLAEVLEQEHPDRVISSMRRSARAGKVFVDWSQNNGHKTTVCPYSLRGRLRPTVAAPRTWDELEEPDLRQLELPEVLERIDPGLDPIAALGRAAEASSASAEEARDRLATYRSMRDAARTPEPVPAAGEPDDRPGGDGAPMFVIQEHHASSLHWDFRIEHDGVLVSWAVPKGPPLTPDANRLAVQTEDHPLGYGTFEGTIPKGEYGGGTVTIWDTGTCDVEKWRDGKEVIAVCRGREDGGLGGVPRRYAFIRTGPMGRARASAKEDRSWLLHLMKDQPDGTDAGTGDPGAGRDDSAGAPADRPAAAPDDHAAAEDARGEPIEPMLATLGSVRDVTGDEEAWAFEMKWDGIRAIASVTTDGVRLTSRGDTDMTATYPELAELVDAIDPTVLAAGEVVLDGEIVALDDADRPSFSRLQQRSGLTRPRDVEAARERQEVHLMVFDLLRRGGASLLRTPYEERRTALFDVLTPTEHVHAPHADHGDVHHAIDLSRRLDLEGVMAKRLTSVYLPGRRTRTWIKLKNEKHQEVVVIGWRHGRGGRSGGIGSLLVAVPDDDGTLHYAGRVGTGFTDRALRQIQERLTGRARKTPPVDDVPAADRRDAEWVRADLVGEVRYAERTTEGRLRQPSWRGWRPDKDAADVRW